MAAESSTTSVRRVVLADDDVPLREGLATLLDRVGFEVVGQAGDASELLSLVRRAVKHRMVVMTVTKRSK